jgi:ribulose 1,5-bisphosphate carboxylase large subunit-like protein
VPQPLPDWRVHLLDSDSLDLDKFIRATYSIAVKAGHDVRQAAVEMLRILTLRSQHVYPSSRTFDAELHGAVTHVGPRGDWTEVTLALPPMHSEPREGIAHLLQLLASPVEYSYAEGVWLQRIDFPRDHLRAMPGPQLGVEGIRRNLQVHGRPILALQVGPRARGLDQADLDLYGQALTVGADLIVDDILLGDPSGALQLEHRAPALVAQCKKAADATGKPKSYLTCLTGTPSQILRKAEWAAQNRVAGFVVNAFAQGFGLLEDLSRAGLGTWIITTNMGSGMVSRQAAPEDPDAAVMERRVVQERRVGIDEQVFSKLSRLSGADAVHTGTVGAQCFDQPWSDAVRTLAQPIAIPGGSFVSPSFRVAEGDLQMINVWPNIRELGIDTIFEVQSALLAEPKQIQPRTKRFMELFMRLPGSPSNEAALNIYRDVARHDGLLQEQIDTLNVAKW